MTLWHFECPECEYDDKEAGSLATDTQIYCWLCASDCGRDVLLRRWPVNNGGSKSHGKAEANRD